MRECACAKGWTLQPTDAEQYRSCMCKTLLVQRQYEAAMKPCIWLQQGAHLGLRMARQVLQHVSEGAMRGPREVQVVSTDGQLLHRLQHLLQHLQRAMDMFGVTPDGTLLWNARQETSPEWLCCL